MPRGFGRLPFLTRRSDRSDRSGGTVPPLARPPVDADTAAVGPPTLLPAMIYREVLFDASEMTPAWARPRQSPGRAAPAQDAPDAPAEAIVKPKRPRRPRSIPTPAPAAAPAKPKRPRKARPSSS